MYHFTESGHGKGPSDGIGAAVKRRLELKILAGKVINIAYETYLFLTQSQNDTLDQKIIYVSSKELQRRFPTKNTAAKTIKGTQSFHMVHQLAAGSGVLTCSDLSCSCMVCLGEEEGPYFFGQYRLREQHYSLNTGKKTIYPVLDKKQVEAECILFEIYDSSLMCLYLKSELKKSCQ